MAARAAAPSMGAAVFIGAEPALDDEVEAPAAPAAPEEEAPEPLLEEDSEPEDVLVSVVVAVLLPDSELDLLPDALVTEPAPVLYRVLKPVVVL